MTEATPRTRVRAQTEFDIRRHARELLVAHGQDAVTLRAIARALGITAPALYRYYHSREDLLRRLREDICTDLAAELHRLLRGLDNGSFTTTLFTVCRGFRRWALDHPQEFTLVFASPTDRVPTAVPTPTSDEQDHFARVFLTIVGPLMIERNAIGTVFDVEIPHGLRAELVASRRSLAIAFAAQNIEVPDEALELGAIYSLLRWWVRIYGHITLEVFQRFPFALTHADQLFDSLLVELAEESGF